MKFYFATFFNYKYLSKGVSLINSLQSHCNDFCLYIIAMDNDTYSVIESLNHRNVVCIHYEQIENSELVKIKETRTPTEFYWSITPWITRYILTFYSLDHCTYLDADIYFFRDPKVIYEEFYGKYSVAITPHNYAPIYDQSKLSGKYCVQFVFFKNDQKGIETLDNWTNSCLEWCYNRHEDGKFGDQKYLDEWPERYDHVKVITNPNVGVAPWNSIHVFTPNKTIFYHFHDLEVITKNIIDLGGYRLHKETVSEIYLPYLEEIKVLQNRFPGIRITGFNTFKILNLIKNILTRNKSFIIKDKFINARIKKNNNFQGQQR